MPVFRWVRPRLDARTTATALAMLSAPERHRHDRLSPEHRGTFLAGRLVLRRLAGEMLGVDPGSVELAAPCPDCGAEHGKPTVAGSALHVSVSRSQHAVVAAASWQGPIGIDVESPEQSAATLAAIGALTGEATVVHWTRVEAILKADGRGLRVDPSAVSITQVDGRLEGSVAGSTARYDVTEVDLAPDVRVSVASAY